MGVAVLVLLANVACGGSLPAEPAQSPSPPSSPPAQVAASSAASAAQHPPSDEEVGALIKKQSQEFSDACASGDAKALDRLLDERVAFMNENGDIATKKDLVDVQPSPPNTSNKLEQTDFTVVVHGNVAVTTFTDNSTMPFHGQTLHASFKSTEVWLQEADGWRMISSQTLAVNNDPPAIALPSKVLDEYVGTYTSDDFVFKISRKGDDLIGAVGSGDPYVIKSEVRDVLFTPGQPRMRRIVVRDAKGKITGLLVRREGRDIVLKRAS